MSCLLNPPSPHNSFFLSFQGKKKLQIHSSMSKHHHGLQAIDILFFLFFFFSFFPFFFNPFPGKKREGGGRRVLDGKIKKITSKPHEANFQFCFPLFHSLFGFRFSSYFPIPPSLYPFFLCGGFKMQFVKSAPHKSEIIPNSLLAVFFFPPCFPPFFSILFFPCNLFPFLFFPI